MQKVKRTPQTPVAWPRTGSVTRLYLNAVSGHGVSVYISQSNWPRHKTNSQWRIHIEGIDLRYAKATRENIENHCLKAAYEWLAQWLERTAPILTVDCATWQDLVQFSTQSSSTKPQSRPLRMSYRPGHNKFHSSRSKSSTGKSGFRPDGWN